MHGKYSFTTEEECKGKYFIDDEYLFGMEATTTKFFCYGGSQCFISGATKESCEATTYTNDVTCAVRIALSGCTFY